MSILRTKIAFPSPGCLVTLFLPLKLLLEYFAREGLWWEGYTRTHESVLTVKTLQRSTAGLAETQSRIHRLCPSHALDPSPQLLWQNKILVSDASVPCPERKARRQLSVLSGSLVTVFWFPSTELMTDSFDLNVETRSRLQHESRGDTYWQESL